MILKIFHFCEDVNFRNRLVSKFIWISLTFIRFYRLISALRCLWAIQQRPKWTWIIFKYYLWSTSKVKGLCLNHIRHLLRLILYRLLINIFLRHSLRHTPSSFMKKWHALFFNDITITNLQYDLIRFFFCSSFRWQLIHVGTLWYFRLIDVGEDCLFGVRQIVWTINWDYVNV